MRSWRIRSFCAVLLAVLPACGGGAGGGGTVPAVAPAPSSSPAEVVERFMRMVAAKDYMGMGRLFGNVEGPVASRDMSSAMPENPGAAMIRERRIRMPPAYMVHSTVL